MTLLDGIAKELELTLDSEMFGEHQELRALKFYTTDGSHQMFSIYAYILILHQDLADRRKGASGIVFMLPVE
jgi:hypothetical protein